MERKPGLRAVLLFFPCLCLLLTACGGSLGDRDREAFLSIRTELLRRETLTLRADLRADYGDRVYDYRLAYTGDADGGVLRFEAPLELEGVAVELEEGHARLRYRDLMLDTGALVREESPAQCFPLLIRTWLRGSVSQCWHEARNGEDCVAAEFRLGETGAEDRILCRTWFRRETGEPVYAELEKDGRVCLLCAMLEPEESA